MAIKMLCLVDQMHVKSCFSWPLIKLLKWMNASSLIAADIADAMSSEYSQKPQSKIKWPNKYDTVAMKRYMTIPSPRLCIAPPELTGSGA